jgi:diadenylate cyclase
MVSYPKRLLLSIFDKNSPLHDGAVIIYKGRISAARCILPVSDLDNLPAQFGLRHRAAIGMSETTDTLVLVVSEETGQLSIVRAGKIHHNLSIQEIRKMINEYLLEEERQEDEPKTKFEAILEEGLETDISEAEESKKSENTSLT